MPIDEIRLTNYKKIAKHSVYNFKESAEQADKNLSEDLKSFKTKSPKIPQLSMKPLKLEERTLSVRKWEEIQEMLWSN